MRVQYRAGKMPWKSSTSLVHSPVNWLDIPVKGSTAEELLSNAIDYFHLTTINYEIRVIDSIGPVAYAELNANPFYTNRE